MEEINRFTTYKIGTINRKVIEQKDQETLQRFYELAFDWANRMGLQGKKVFGLSLKKTDSQDDNPLNVIYHLCCNIERTIEEKSQ